MPERLLLRMVKYQKKDYKGSDDYKSSSYWGVQCIKTVEGGNISTRYKVNNSDSHYPYNEK